MDAAVASFQTALQASPEPPRPDNRIQVVVDGNGLILRGVVQNDRERYLAEVLAGLTPGVRGVHNELTVHEGGTTMAPR
jgi:osmotically-inducible protein OsmY